MKILYRLIIFFLLFPIFIYGQNSSLREKFIYDLAKENYIEWPNKSIDTFRIAVLNDDVFYKELNNYLSKKIKFFGKPVTCKLATNFKEVFGSNLIYTHQNRNPDIQEIQKKLSGKSILIVGENYDFQSCMINFIANGNEISIDVNQKLISEQGLKVLPSLEKKVANNKDQWNGLLSAAKAELADKQEELIKREEELDKAILNLQQQKQLIKNKQEELFQTSEKLTNKSDSLQLAQDSISVQNNIMQFQESQLAAEKNTRKALIAMFIAVFLLAVAIFFAFRTYRKANKNLNNLNKAILKHKSEIFHQKKLLEVTNREMVDSITYAKRIQNTILPSDSEIQNAFKESFVLFKPKDIVSGDFYWMLKRENEVFFAVADCTGHGVPGALISMICSRLLNGAVREKKLSEPAEILDDVNQTLKDSLIKGDNADVNDGMDIALCKFDFNKKTLHYAGAYNPIYIVKGDVLQEIKADRQPIGSYVFKKKFTNNVIQLSENDAVYLFTDGYLDQFGGNKGKKLMNKSFKKLLISVNEMPLSHQKSYLNNYFEEWRKSQEQIDDVCVVGVRL